MNREKSTLVSCLCVTENRPAFMPWLLWNFEKQSWRRRELIIVDSSPVPFDAGDREDVHVVAAPPGSTIAAKRNRALAEAHGAIVTWFDDDDWQHPDKCTRLVQALADGAPYAGASRSWFVNVESFTCAPFQARNGRIIFNSAGFQRAVALAARFPEHVRRASDSHWLQALQRRHPRAAVALQTPTFFWLSHGQNISNPVGKRRCAADLDAIREGVGSEAWGETDEKLAALQERLCEQNDTVSGPLSRQHDGVDRDFDGNHPAPARSQNGRQRRHPNRRTQSAPSLPADPAAAPCVSACLLSWKRPQNLQPIVDSLRRHAFIDEILVWNNNPDVDLDLQGDRVRVIQSPRNEICYGRFLCARQARNSIVYTQDDDVIVDNVPALLQHFLRDDSRITHALSRQHMRRRDRYVYAQGHHALLGWGSFFRKTWLARLDDYVDRHGCDDVLRRGADKIFTILQGRTHNTVDARLRTLAHSTTPGIAMYREPGHVRQNSLAVRQALAALRERMAVPYPVTWNVVIPCYNYGRFLGEAVESVLHNDADYVVTIMDDASTDETERVGRRYADDFDHVSYVRLAENRGVGHARNCGIAAVDSLFVVLLDADDRIGPDYLYEAEALLRTGCDVANPDAILFGRQRVRWPVPEWVTEETLRQHNRVHCAAAFRRSYWGQVGGICEEMTHWMDYDFWVKLAKAGARIQRVDGDHFYYRKHGTSKSTEASERRSELMATIRRRHWSR